MNLDAQERRRLLDAAPWYANGTLPVTERHWVDGAMQRDPWARAVVANWTAVGAAVAETETVALDDAVFDRLMHRIEHETRKVAVTADTGSLLRRLQSAMHALLGGALSPVAAMASVVIAVQGIVIGYMASGDAADEERFRAAGGTGRPVPALRVMIAPEASEAALRARLLQLDLRIGGGPTQIGEYWLRRHQPAERLEDERAAVDALARSLQDDPLFVAVRVDETQGER